MAPVYHLQGGFWNRQAELTVNQNGNAITVAGGMTLWAVADSGAVAMSNDGGGIWDDQTSGTTAWLGGVHAPSPRECWAVGEGGMIRRTTDAGATWELDSSESTSDLYGVRMIDNTHGRAVGADGRILYRTGGVGVAEGRAEAVRRPGATLVRDQLRLRLDVSGQVQVRLLDAAGRLARGLYSGPARPELDLSLAGVPAGAYFVEVASPGRRDALRLVRLD